MFRSLDIRTQLQLLLADQRGMMQFIKRAEQLLPTLSDHDLVTIAAFFDPRGENMSKNFSPASQKSMLLRRGYREDRLEDQVFPDEYLEFFITGE